MSKTLETAIAKLRDLPRRRQNEAVKRLLEFVDENPSASERISIEAAREAYANGDFPTLSAWKRDVGLTDN